MRVLLAGATGVIGRQAVPVLAAAGHQVIGLARTPIQLPDAEMVAVDALDRAAVADAVRSARPDVIVHMLTAIPDPVDPTAPGPGHGPDQPAAHRGDRQPGRRRRRRPGDRPRGGLRL